MKILIISDTHSNHDLVPTLPEADVFIHAGDFMNGGTDWREIRSFNAWLSSVPVPRNRRFIIAGNHDILFDQSHKGSSPLLAKQARSLITNANYIQDEAFDIDGVKFYFSPWTPAFFGWGFNARRGPEIAEIWAKIPDDTQVLVTHGPPYGILDQIKTQESDHLGCEDLQGKLRKIWPKFHIFGHIHGSRGQTIIGPTTYINASFLNEKYKPHPGPGYFLVEI